MITMDAIQGSLNSLLVSCPVGVRDGVRALRSLVPSSLLCNLSRCLLMHPWITDEGHTVSTIRGTLPGVSLRFRNRVLQDASSQLRNHVEALLKGPLITAWKETHPDFALTLCIFFALGPNALQLRDGPQPTSEELFCRANEMGNVAATGAAFPEIGVEMCGVCMTRLSENGVVMGSGGAPLSRFHFDCIRDQMALSPDCMCITFFIRDRPEIHGAAAAAMDSEGWVCLPDDAFTLSLSRRYGSGWNPLPSVWVHPSEHKLGLLGNLCDFNPSVRAGKRRVILLPSSVMPLHDQITELHRFQNHQSGPKLSVEAVTGNETPARAASLKALAACI